jgi:hypothetical protein
MDTQQRKQDFSTLQKIGLLPPTIPVADTDGLIATSELDKEIIITLATWDYADPNESYQLILNGAPIGPVKQLPSPAPVVGTELFLALDPVKEFGVDGQYYVSYRVRNVIGGQFADSESTVVLVDRTPPGATLLAPMILPGATLGDRLSALLPGYAGMAVGDVIQTRCNGVPGPVYTVEPEDLSIRPIEIHFEREHLHDLGDEHLTLDYTVTDRAGNVSPRSVPKLLTLQI